MPRHRTSRKAKRSRRTRRRNQRGGDASIADAIVGDAIIRWLKESVAGTWQDDQWKMKKFFEDGWPVLKVDNPDDDAYQFTLPGYMRTNVYTIINILQRPGSRPMPTTATDYTATLVELSEEKALVDFVTIENILRNKLNVAYVTDKTIISPDESLLLWFLANAVKEISEDETTALIKIEERAPKGNSAPPAQPAV